MIQITGILRAGTFTACRVTDWIPVIRPRKRERKTTRGTPAPF